MCLNAGTRNKLSSFLIVGLSAFLMFGCENRQGFASKESLRVSIHEYFEAEKNKDWSTAYSYRSSDFQRDVPLSLYIRDMAKDSKCCHLEKYEIKSIALSGKYANVSVLYVDVWHGDQLNKSLYEDLWFFQDNEWRAVNLSHRFYLPLNSSSRPLPQFEES